MNLLPQPQKSQIKRQLLILSVCCLLGQTTAFGQSIAPANDGTGTTVNPQGNRIDIGGGQQSGDGANLFHSFQRFGLNKNQTANFIANPNIQNILGRIVGGDVSIINGLIQVSGGNANLFLINPAGIIFGTTAQLNVPASFTATTANSIGFGNNSLSAIGFNNYLALTGMPTSFGFSAITPASIVNRGNLAVKQGGNLTLLGGNVTNTGQVSAEEGQIYIVTVPEKSIVRISQPGYLLSIEVSSEALNSQSNTANADSEKSTATLPEMLTGGGGPVNASDVAVSSDGSVKLTNSNPPKSSQNNLGTNNSGAVRLSQIQNNMPPQQTNTGNNTPPNTNTATAPQPNTGNNTPSNTNTATAPQPNTGNLTAPPNTNGGTAPQPNTGNNTPPNTNTATAPQPNTGNLTAPPNTNGGTAPQPNAGNNTPPNINGGTAPQPNAGNNTPPNINGGTAPQPNAGNNTPPNINGGTAPQPNAGNNTPPNINGGTAPQPNAGNNTPPNINGGTAPQPNAGNNTPPNINGGTAPQPNAGNNTPPNINGGTAPQPNAGNLNTRPNDNNKDISQEPNMRNPNAPASNSNGGTAPQPNTGNLNSPPNNMQLPPPNIVQNTLVPNIQPNFPINEQLIPRNSAVPIMNNMELLSTRSIIDNLPANRNIDRNSIINDVRPNSIVNEEINSNRNLGSNPNNVQGFDSRGFADNSPQPAAENISETRGRSGENLPPSVPNIPTVGANSPGNLQALANMNSLLSLDQNRADQYADYFGNGSTNPNLTAENIRETLIKIASNPQTGNNRSAIIYINLFADRVELSMLGTDGSAIIKTVREANRESVLELAQKLRAEISNPRQRNTTSYKPFAEKLYGLLIAPLEANLQEQNINTLLFSMDAGLRSLPLAALYDGKQFLVEKYSFSQIPAFFLTDTSYQSLQNASVLAMGSAEFNQLDPLPSVPTELNTIVSLWQGKSFLNEQFTLNNLQSQRRQNAYQIIHLATHSEFRPGVASNSFIQLWDAKLKLNDLRKLGWSNPPVELLVLSSCRTALGDKQSELGFAGLAFQAGVKSALASLWYVSDEGTLALMSEFYHQLKTAPIKAEALRQAQIAMIKGQVSIENGVLRGPFAVSSQRGGENSLPLPKIEIAGDINLSHPYFWAAFTMIGSPW